MQTLLALPGRGQEFASVPGFWKTRRLVAIHAQRNVIGRHENVVAAPYQSSIGAVLGGGQPSKRALRRLERMSHHTGHVNSNLACLITVSCTESRNRQCSCGNSPPFGSSGRLPNPVSLAEEYLRVCQLSSTLENIGRTVSFIRKEKAPENRQVLIA